MKVIIQPRAKKELKGLPDEARSELLKKLFLAGKDPRKNLQKLSGHSLWKLRAGQYRAVLFMDTKNELLHVVKVGHRKNVYKRL